MEANAAQVQFGRVSSLKIFAGALRDMSGSELKVYAVIAAHSNKDWRASVSVGRLSELTGLTERSCYSAIAGLVKSGLIKKEKGGGRGLMTIFTILNGAETLKPETVKQVSVKQETLKSGALNPEIPLHGCNPSISLNREETEGEKVAPPKAKETPVDAFDGGIQDKVPPGYNAKVDVENADILDEKPEVKAFAEFLGKTSSANFTGKDFDLLAAMLYECKDPRDLAKWILEAKASGIKAPGALRKYVWKSLDGPARKAVEKRNCAIRVH